MNTNPFYWLPLWADKDPLSLDEAAALLCNLEPRARPRRRDESKDERIERERIDTMRARLVRAIDAGPDAPDGLAGTVHRWRIPAQYERNLLRNNPVAAPFKPRLQRGRDQSRAQRPGA